MHDGREPEVREARRARALDQNVSLDNCMR